MNLGNRFGSAVGTFRAAPSASTSSPASVGREAHVETMTMRAVPARQAVSPGIGASRVAPSFQAPTEAGGAPQPSQGREAHAETRRLRPLSADLMSGLKAVAAHVVNDENADRGRIGSVRKYLERIDTLGVRERSALGAVGEDDMRAFIDAARRYSKSWDIRHQLGIPGGGWSEDVGKFGPFGPGGHMPGMPGLPGKSYRDAGSGLTFTKPDGGMGDGFGWIAGFGGHHGGITTGSGQSLGGGPHIGFPLGGASGGPPAGFSPASRFGAVAQMIGDGQLPDDFTAHADDPLPDAPKPRMADPVRDAVAGGGPVPPLSDAYIFVQGGIARLRTQNAQMDVDRRIRDQAPEDDNWVMRVSIEESYYRKTGVWKTAEEIQQEAEENANKKKPDSGGDMPNPDGSGPSGPRVLNAMPNPEDPNGGGGPVGPRSSQQRISISAGREAMPNPEDPGSPRGPRALVASQQRHTGSGGDVMPNPDDSGPVGPRV